MREGGQVITDRDEIGFWIKRYHWMKWVSMMDDWTLELTMIGMQAPVRPFYNDYRDKGRLDRLRKLAGELVARSGYTPERRILVEETFTENVSFTR